MANNIIQVKRTSVSGRTPNTTSSGNSQYIAAGELALNMIDGILYTSNGSSLITIGANNANVNITNKLTANSIIAGKLQHSPVPISKLLTAFDAADNDQYGRTALSGDASVLAVGAQTWEGATGTNRGGVYIYDWNGSNWIQRGSVLEAADAADNDSFGLSIALNYDASVLVVGANQWEGTTGTDRGGVYIYDWNGSNWIQRGSVLEAADAADTDLFGSFISLSSNGSVLAVGARQWEGTTGTNRGGVYIYDWNGSSWVQRGSVLEAADAADNDTFSVVSLNGNATVLAVGAAGWEGATGTDRGGVYIYDWNGTSWIQRGSVLEAADAADSDQFGGTVALSSDASVLAVGAFGWEGTTGTNRGGVYIFDWNGSAWVQRGSVLEATDAADSDRFGGYGICLSSDSSILIVSSAQWEGTTGTGRGAVYTYSLTGALPSYTGVATGSGWIEGSNSSLIARTAGLDRINIAAGGNVGIGNTTPTTRLVVTGNTILGTNSSSSTSIGGIAIINNDVEIAAKNTAANASNTQTIITSFSANKYRGGKFTILGKRSTESHITEVLLTHNTSNAYLTEYSVLYTNTSLFSVSASIVSENVQVVVTSSLSDINYDIFENKFINELGVFDRSQTVVLDRSGSTIETRAA